MDINGYIDKWWKGKSGRNLEDYKRFHKSIISRTIPEEDYEGFFNDLEDCKFDLSKTRKLIPIRSIFKGTKIEDYVTNNYLAQCFKVTVKQPSNGAGEFLLAANFKNIKFGSTCDLLIDNHRVEVKGEDAKLGDFASKFKQMDSSLEFTINKHFNEHWNIKNFNKDVMGAILHKIFSNVDNLEHIKFLGNVLQNTKSHDSSITAGFVKLFRTYVKSTENIEEFKRCICAIHLYNYCRTKNCGYIIFVNNNDMVLFKSPRSAEDYFNITNYLKIGSWENGRGGITITLK